MKRILVNVDRCSGCRRCEVLCGFAHENQFRSSVARVHVVKEDVWGFDLPIFCNNCDECAAISNCPSKALFRDTDGLVTVDEKCNGCGSCVRACRFHAIRLHPDKRTPLFCDFCGGKPLCVEKCPTGALTFVETEFAEGSPADKVMKDTLKRWKVFA